MPLFNNNWYGTSIQPCTCSHLILYTSKDLFGNWEYLTVKMYLLDRLYSGGFESGNLTG